MVNTRRILGLMSGTSADGIDAVLCDVAGSGSNLTVHIVGHHWHSFEPELQRRILEATTKATPQELGQLNVELGHRLADACLICLEKFGPADLIASHGQTIWHQPSDGVTLQIGEPAVIAERTRLPVMVDFRQSDVAAGGQGAPLVPYLDWALFRSRDFDRVLLNLGGIANCTVLPADCSLNGVRGWDTGPANMVIDHWARDLLGQPYDIDGQTAAKGTVIPELLDAWLGHPFFAAAPPKSTGREEFGGEFAEMARPYSGAPADVLATATLLTAKTVADSLKSELATGFELFVSGGGARNAHLLRLLQTKLPGAKIAPLEALGMASEHKEAVAFAVFAHETLNGVPSNVPSVTGARHPVLQGKLVQPPPLS